jgi:glutamine synthetase type III
LRRETILALQEVGINVEVSHHEVAPSQHEIDLRFDNALQMADKVQTYKTVVKEVATRHGVYATFMPKPLANENGSGMHTHQSLFTGDRNAFFDADNQYYLSEEAQAFIAPAAPRARDQPNLRPVRKLLQAAGSRLRGTGLHRLESQEPLGPDKGSRLPPGSGEGHPDRVP